MKTSDQSAAAGAFSIGIDLGGTNLRIGAYSRELRPLETIALPTRLADGPQSVLREMAAAVASLWEKCASHGACVGVGVGSPGPLQLPAGVLCDPSNLPGWAGLELKIELEKLLHLPVTADSDANTAALAESKFGAGRSFAVDSLAMLTLGTGVGGGLVLDGKLWHGALGMAAEPGHTVVYPGGLTCNCDSQGCLEMYASAMAVRRMALEAVDKPGGKRLKKILLDTNELHAHDVATLAREGDPSAQLVFATVGSALGIGIAMWVSALNLPLYVLGGGMAQAWDLFAPQMFRALKKNSQTYRLTEPEEKASFTSGKTNVLPAQLGPEAGLMGAALLPWAEN